MLAVLVASVAAFVPLPARPQPPAAVREAAVRGVHYAPQPFLAPAAQEPAAAFMPEGYVVVVNAAPTPAPVSTSAVAQCVGMLATVGMVAGVAHRAGALQMNADSGLPRIMESGWRDQPVGKESYSERSRAYRRSVYFHDNWIKHRSNDRYIRNFRTLFDSGVVRSLSSEILLVTGIAVLVVTLNMLLGGYDDLSMVHHAAPVNLPLLGALSLPSMPFTIAMPALSLLLVFRTNTAYFRWNEARTLWGGVVNTTRNLQRQSNVYFAKEDTQLRDQLTREVALFPKALRSFLRGSDDDPIFREDATKLVGPYTAEALMVSKNRATFVTNMISATVQRANLNPMDRARMDDCVCKLVDQLGACERIFRSPIPLVYTRHTARFLTSFMVLLPLALWEPMKGTWNHWATIPATTILAIFLFGIEELGIQIEEPFGILPLEALCDTSIEGVVMDMQESYKKGFFGELRDGTTDGYSAGLPPSAEGPPLSYEDYQALAGKS
jgi:predicted membrane chloride channel (bestrophin family)